MRGLSDGMIILPGEVETNPKILKERLVAADQEFSDLPFHRGRKLSGWQLVNVSDNLLAYIIMLSNAIKTCKEDEL